MRCPRDFNKVVKGGFAEDWIKHGTVQVKRQRWYCKVCHKYTIKPLEDLPEQNTP